MRHHTTALYGVRERTRVTPIRELAKQPGIRAIYRLTMYYADGRSHNAVATLTYRAHETQHRLDVVYEGLFNHAPIEHSVPHSAYEGIRNALSKAKFDNLPDQEKPYAETRTLWMLERATGAFYKSVVLSPHHHDMPYTLITNALDHYLPEALREIPKSTD